MHGSNAGHMLHVAISFSAATSSSLDVSSVSSRVCHPELIVDVNDKHCCD